MPRILLSIALSFAAWGMACVDPCEELGQRVCDCRDSQASAKLCLREMEARQALGAADTTAQQLCVERLESCDCAALKRGDLAACGLAEPACEGEGC